MLNKIKENKFTILGILIVLLIAFYFGTMEREKTTILKEKPFEKRLCYLDKSPSPIKKGKFNLDYIEININENRKEEVSGKMAHLPWGADSMKGEFIGALDDNILNMIVTADAEGETWKEQKFYHLDDDKIKPADYLEKTMVEGVSIIPDATKVTFNGEYSVPKVDCDVFDRELENWEK